MHHAALKETVSVEIGGRKLTVWFNHRSLMRIAETTAANNGTTLSPAEQAKQHLEQFLLGLDNRWNRELEGGVPTEEWLSDNIDARDMKEIVAAIREAIRGNESENPLPGASPLSGSTSGPLEPAI